MRFIALLLTLFAFSLWGKTTCLQGILLNGSPKEKPFQGAHGIHFHNFTPPGNPQALKTTLAEDFLGKEINKELIVQIEKSIIDYFKANDHPLVIVYTPEQKISGGVIEVRVVESRIGKIEHVGNKHTPTKQLEKGVRQKPGDTYDANLVQQDLIWLNRNPFRETVLLLDPGEEEGTTDIRFMTKDDFPYRLFIGTDNTGIESTGRNRFFVGVNFGNLFHLDQRLTYQYTVSTNFGRFFAHTGQYIIPLPWRHIINLYGGYSGIKAIVPLTDMTSSGNAWQGSLRYVIPLTGRGSYNHEFQWGLDYKETNINLVLAAVPILGNRAMITQAMLGYNGSLENPVADMSFQFEWFISPGDIFAHQSSSDYGSLRPGAKAHYTYARGAFTPVFKLPRKFQALIKSEFQVASNNLLSSEQFGLGGLYTIRGYEERILNTDNGLLLSSEVRTPPLHPLTQHSKENPNRDILQFLAFLDYGFGVNHEAVPGERNYRYLLSTGLGVRYQYSYHINARVDMGYPLHRHIDRQIVQPPGVHFNFSVVASY